MPHAVPENWTQTDNSLTRTIQRADFVDAIALVVEIGRMAEAADHHPDIDIRYRTIHLNLSTHSAGNKVTAKDVSLAQKINALPEDVIRHTRDELQRRFKA